MSRERERWTDRRRSWFPTCSYPGRSVKGQMQERQAVSRVTSLLFDRAGLNTTGRTTMSVELQPNTQRGYQSQSKSLSRLPLSHEAWAMATDAVHCPQVHQHRSLSASAAALSAQRLGPLLGV